MTGSWQHFDALVDNDPDAISLINAEGQVLYASAAAAKVLGYEPEELLGRNGFDLLHPQDRDRCMRSLRKLLAEPQADARIQARFRRKDGGWRWVQSTASNLLDVPRVGAIIVVYREIHDGVPDEDALRHTADELQLQVAELKAFAHTVAHDLREPLRSIGACTELLLRSVEVDEENQLSARYIVDGVRRMDALLDKLLASATLGLHESFRSVNLEDAAAQALENLRAAVNSSGALVTVHPLPVVPGVETDLVRVFENLIGNALKYRGTAPVTVDITAENSGPDVVIRVRDNGIGIPKEQHRGVFGLFRRLHPHAVEGTGIGLAVCKNIVERSGGAIWVESEPGNGSTFCFTVPAEHVISGTRPLSADALESTEPAHQMFLSARHG